MGKKKIIFISVLLVIILLNIFPLKPNYKSPTKENIMNSNLTTHVIDSFRGVAFSSYTKYQDLQTSDGGYIVTAADFMGVGHYRTDNSDLISLITKFNNDFQQVWSIGGNDGILIDNHYIYIYKIAELNDGNYVGIGKATLKSDELSDGLNTNAVHNAQGDLVLLKISSEGDIVFTKSFNDLDINDYIYNYPDYEGNFFSFDITSTSDDGFTIVTNNSKIENTLIAHFSKDAILSWHKLINFDEQTRCEVSMVSDAFDNYYLYGLSYHNVYNLNKIVKISSQGIIKWEQNYNFSIENMNILNNQLIISGSKSPSDLLNQKISYLFFINTDNNGVGYHNFAVNSSVDTDTGKVKWVNYYNLKDFHTISISATTDNDKSIYSYVITSYASSTYEMVIKYNLKGKKVGETILNKSYNDYWPQAYSTFMNINSDQIVLVDSRDKSYNTINLNELVWSNPQNINYNEIKFYQEFLIIRVWINRIVLLSMIAIFAYSSIKYDRYYHSIE